MFEFNHIIYILLFISIIIILVLLFLYLIKNNKKKQNITNKLQKKVINEDYYEKNYNIYFLNKYEGKQLINKHHQIYLKKLQKLELNKKNININDSDFNNFNNRIHILNSFYNNNILEFTKDEKDKIIFTIHLTLKNINPKISKNIINNYFKNWNILKVSNLFEDKLPHTIHNVIILPQDFITLLKKINENQNENQNILIKEIGSTLLHEQIHIWQRLHPKLFNTLYVKYWNFKKGPCNIINNILEKENNIFQRKNPDGLDENWLFNYTNNEYLLISVKLKNDSKDLGDIQKYGILLSKDNYEIITIQKLNTFKYFYSFFGIKDNNYHPNELSASMISENLFLPQFFNNKNIMDSISFKNLEKWIILILF